MTSLSFGFNQIYQRVGLFPQHGSEEEEEEFTPGSGSGLLLDGDLAADVR